MTAILMTTACTPKPHSPAGFRLPDGDFEKGQQAFQDLSCGGCHRVNGQSPMAPGNEALVLLGGEVLRVKTYGELVTSIINPSHKINPQFLADNEWAADSESPMAAININQIMTVQQLVDVVAYLQPTYEVVPPSVSPYSNYYPLH